MKASKTLFWIVGGVIAVSTLVSIADNSSQPTTQPTSVLNQNQQYKPVQPVPPPTQVYQVPKEAGLSNDNYYKNVDGNKIHSPAYSNSVPTGATAQCRDGTYSFSQHRSGTCSHHGGVAQWL